MHQSRLFALSVTLIATLLTWQSAAAQVPARQARPVGPIETRLPPVAQPNLVPAWVFADIHVTVMGPNSVKIEWVPRPQGFAYHVKRNGVEITSFTSDPNETRVGTFLDNAAPANSAVSYSVAVQYHGAQVPDTSGVIHIGDGSTESKIVSVVTPVGLAAHQLIAAPPVKMSFAEPPPLRGWVDLHAHPMSYLGFGGKLIYGAVDDQAMRPPTPGCPSRGPLSNENDFYGWPILVPPPPLQVPTPCGNAARWALIEAIQSPAGLWSHPFPPATYVVSGPPAFITWPVWDDVLRQTMWWEWIYRAYQGGQRVMVALAVNSKLLGDAILGGNTNSDLPTDDLHSTDIQISELTNFVNRHPFMQIAHNSSELHDIVSRDKLAIVMGVEIDNIGNLVGNVPAPIINSAIDHLYGEGVRYIFPVHLVNNPIGKSAVYEDMFLVANAYEEGAQMNLMCVQNQNIKYQYSSTEYRLGMIVNMGPKGLSGPTPVPCDQNNGWGNINGGDLDPSGHLILDSGGHPVGLSQAGQQAIQHMMDLGMLIDIDHMSGASVDGTLALAARNSPVAYPLFSGHNNLRTSAGDGSFKERQLTPGQYTELFARHGMAGIGAAKTPADLWLSSLMQTLIQGKAMGRPVAFGTDADGLEFMMPPRRGANVNLATPLPPPALPLMPAATTGLKTWDYNHDGVAHYGLLPDFLLDVQSLPAGASVVNQMFKGAQYFYETWALAERDAKPPSH